MKDADHGTNKQTRLEEVTVKLRDLVLAGKLAPGQRVQEGEIAEAFQVSRTPVRVALGILKAEGLLEGQPNRGFMVRRFTQADVLSAFDVRGALEGLACRTVAEHSLSPEAAASLEQCLEVGECLQALESIDDAGMRRWAIANNTFHRTIIAAAHLPALDEVYNFLSRMPLASPVAILFRGDRRERAVELIRQSHLEHTQVYAAIRRGEGVRAEHLIREHAYRSRENVQLEMQADKLALPAKVRRRGRPPKKPASETIEARFLIRELEH